MSTCQTQHVFFNNENEVELHCPLRQCSQTLLPREDSSGNCAARPSENTGRGFAVTLISNTTYDVTCAYCSNVVIRKQHHAEWTYDLVPAALVLGNSRPFQKFSLATSLTITHWSVYMIMTALLANFSVLTIADEIPALKPDILERGLALGRHVASYGGK